jgi:hypothetical protein
MEDEKVEENDRPGKRRNQGEMLFLFSFIGRVAGTGGHIISFAFEFSNYIVNIFV